MAANGVRAWLGVYQAGRDSMDTFVIEGGKRLFGRVRINGSKNAALPMLATALLTDQKVTLRDVPSLADVKNMLRLLGELGCPSQGIVDGAVTLQSTDESLLPGSISVCPE